jgi:hypothetical protein
VEVASLRMIFQSSYGSVVLWATLDGSIVEDSMADGCLDLDKR